MSRAPCLAPSRKRQNSDYEDFAEITAEEAGRVAVEVPAFVEGCAKALERLLAQAAGRFGWRRFTRRPFRIRLNPEPALAQWRHRELAPRT
jgi:hypothetical protein